MGTVHIPAVAAENIKNGAARKTDLAGDSSKNIQMQETEKAFNGIGVSILDRVTFKKVSRPKRAYKKDIMDIQHWTGPVPQTWVLEPCSTPPGLGRAATKAAKVATAKMAILENMVIMNVVKRV